MLKNQNKQEFIDFLLSSNESFLALLPSFQTPSNFEPLIMEILSQTPQTDPLILFNILHFLNKVLDKLPVSDLLLQKILFIVNERIPGLFHMAKLEDRDKKTLEEAFQRFVVEIIFSEKTPFLRKSAQELQNLGVNPPNPLIFRNHSPKFQSLTKILDLMPFKEKMGSMYSQQSNQSHLKSKDDNNRLKDENEKLRGLIQALEKKIIKSYTEIEEIPELKATKIADFSALDPENNHKIEDLEIILSEKEQVLRHLEKISEDYQTYNNYLTHQTAEKARESEMLLNKYSVQKNPREELKALIKSLKQENDFLKKRLFDIHGVAFNDKPPDIPVVQMPGKPLPSNKRPRNYDSQLINMTRNSFDQSPMRIFDPMRAYKSVENENSLQVVLAVQKKSPFLQSNNSNYGSVRVNNNSNDQRSSERNQYASYEEKSDNVLRVSQMNPNRLKQSQGRLNNEERPLAVSQIRNSVKNEDDIPDLIVKEPKKNQDISPLRTKTYEFFDEENMRRSVVLNSNDKGFLSKRTNKLEISNYSKKEINSEEKGYYKVEIEENDKEFKDFSEFAGENLVLLKKACLLNKGVLYEDPEIQLAYISQTANHKQEILLKINAFFTNKTDSPLDDFEIKFIGNSTISLWTRNQINGQALSSKTQKNQELIIKFHEIPFTALLQKCSYKFQGKIRRILLVIPCALTKFLNETMTDAKEFKVKWDLLKKESVCYADHFVPNTFLVKGPSNMKKYFQYLIELRPDKEYDFLAKKGTLTLGGLFYVETMEKELLIKIGFKPNGTIGFKVAAKRGDFKLAEFLVKTMIFLFRK